MTTQATPTEQLPAQRRPGAQPGDRRAWRHGLRGSGFPASCRKEESSVNQFKRTAEDAVFAARGEVTLLDAAAIHTATRWERHALLAARWLRVHGESMTHSERLAYSRDVATASTARDKALESLKLPRRGDASVWATVKLVEGRNG